MIEAAAQHHANWALLGWFVGGSILLVVLVILGTALLSAVAYLLSK